MSYKHELLIVPLFTRYLLLQTIENQRVKDETMVQEGDEEVMADEQQDEFAGVGNAAQVIGDDMP